VLPQHLLKYDIIKSFAIPENIEAFETDIYEYIDMENCIKRRKL